MTCADLTGPIPAATVRISVRWGDALFVTDIPSGDIAETMIAFEEFAGPALELFRKMGLEWTFTLCDAELSRIGDNAGITTDLWDN